MKEPGILVSAGATAYAPAAPRRFDQLRQDVASAAHLRGVILVKGTHADGSPVIVGSIAAKDLCVAIRSSYENTRGNDGRHNHVRQLVFQIAMRLGHKGAVQVSRMTWNLLQGYAKPEPPKRCRK